jgi:hypothetical protein
VYTFSLNSSFGALLDRISDDGSESIRSVKLRDFTSTGTPITPFMLSISWNENILIRCIGLADLFISMSVEKVFSTDFGCGLSVYGRGKGHKHFVSASPTSPLHILLEGTIVSAARTEP